MSPGAERYVIIGNSAAGVAAAEAIRKADPRGPITLVSEEPYPAYSRIFLPNYMAGDIPLDRMYIRDVGFYSRLGVTALLGCRAERVDPCRGLVEVSSRAGSQALPYDRLLLATGASPVPLAVPGSSLPGVNGLRSIGDAEDIARRLRGNGPGCGAVIIGGGLVSMKSAEALVSLGARVTVVVSSATVLSQMADQETAGMVRRRMDRAGIRVLTNRGVDAIEGDTGVREVVLDGGERIPAAVVVVGKGVRPNTDLASRAGIRCGKGISVDPWQRTSIRHVYAAGDAAETVLHDRPALNAMWPNAVAQGKTAGNNMAGADTVCSASVRVNAGSFFGLPLASVGQIRAREDQSEVVVGPSGVNYQKFVFEGKRLVGAILAGNINTIGTLAWLVSREEQPSRIISSLISGRPHYARMLAPSSPATTSYLRLLPPVSGSVRTP